MVVSVVAVEDGVEGTTQKMGNDDGCCMNLSSVAVTL